MTQRLIIQNKLILTALCLIWASAFPASADDILQELDAQQLASVRSGEAVLKIVDVKGESWPVVTLYQKFDASPEECVAVFGNCESHKDFFPHLNQSVITQIEAPHILEVEYSVSLPFLPNQTYTLRSSLNDYNEGSSFVADWKLVKSGALKTTQGSARFEPFEGGTLVAYQNFVVPKSSFALMFKKQALEQVQNAFHAFRERVIFQKNHAPAILEQEILGIKKVLEDSLEHRSCKNVLS